MDRCDSSILSLNIAIKAKAPHKMLTSVRTRKATLEDAHLLHVLGSHIFRESFAHENTEENMKAYCDEYFGDSQQAKEIEDPLNYILFIEALWDSHLDDHFKQRDVPSSKIQLFDNSFVTAAVSETTDRTAKWVTIGYSKLRHTSSEPCLVYQGSQTIELCRFYVLTEFHGCGVAQQLMDENMRVSREKFHCQSIWLGVWEKNNKALKFYQKFNFEKVGNHQFILGDDIQNDYIMELTLPK